jgi:hypothetical protein
MLSRRLFGFTALCVATAGGSALAHGFHASFSVLEFNARTGSLEIIHRIFIQDLELALSDETKAPFTLNDSPEHQARVRDYLIDVFRVSADGKPLTIDWVGFELKVDTMFVYQEVRNAGAPKTLTVKDSILTTSHPGQVNTVNITKDGRTQTLIFTKTDDAQTVSI